MDDDNAILDAFDPVRRTYRDYLLKLKVAAVVLGMLLLSAAMAGVPHVQTDYRLYGSRPVGRAPAASEKCEARYLGPFGGRLIVDGQYGQTGCPVIVLVPLRDCLGDGAPATLSSAVSRLLSSKEPR